MASNVITFIAVAALATCLATVSAVFDLPAGVYCTASNSTACTQRYPNTVCRHEEQVCKYGDTTCVCADGYAQYEFYNSTSQRYEYSCRPATVPLGGLCSIPVGNTCSGYRTSCRYYNTTDSVCECDYGYKPNSAGTDCTPLELGQNCTTSYGPCGANTYCDKHDVCRCKPGYKAYDTIDCTHYVPGDACPATECEFTERGSCGYGTCKDGVFACIPGSKWWQASTPNGESPSPLVDGMCLRNTATVVGTGELCDPYLQQDPDYVCRSNRCVSCPEQSDVYICNGATFSKTMSAATALLLLLACYLFH